LGPGAPWGPSFGRRFTAFHSLSPRKNSSPRCSSFSFSFFAGPSLSVAWTSNPRCRSLRSPVPTSFSLPFRFIDLIPLFPFPKTFFSRDHSDPLERAGFFPRLVPLRCKIRLFSLDQHFARLLSGLSVPPFSHLSARQTYPVRVRPGLQRKEFSLEGSRAPLSFFPRLAVASFCPWIRPHPLARSQRSPISSEGSFFSVRLKEGFIPTPKPARRHRASQKTAFLFLPSLHSSGFFHGEGRTPTFRSDRQNPTPSFHRFTLLLPFFFFPDRAGVPFVSDGPQGARLAGHFSPHSISIPLFHCVGLFFFWTGANIPKAPSPTYDNGSTFFLPPDGSEGRHIRSLSLGPLTPSKNQMSDAAPVSPLSLLT